MLTERIEGSRDLLMRDNLLLLFPKMSRVRTMHAWLCSDLACVDTTPRVVA